MDCFVKYRPIQFCSNRKSCILTPIYANTHDSQKTENEPARIVSNILWWNRRVIISCCFCLLCFVWGCVQNICFYYAYCFPFIETVFIIFFFGKISLLSMFENAFIFFLDFEMHARLLCIFNAFKIRWTMVCGSRNRLQIRVTLIWASISTIPLSIHYTGKVLT